MYKGLLLIIRSFIINKSIRLEDIIRAFKNKLGDYKNVLEDEINISDKQFFMCQISINSSQYFSNVHYYNSV